jgi:uncharacterized protein (DUF58 family)
MRLTRRGWAALVVVAVSITLAWAAGERALNAIAAPTLAAVLFGALVVARAETPTVSFGSLASGPPGEQRTLTIDIDGGGVVTVDLALPDGLAGTDVSIAVTPEATVERSVRLGRRGVYRLESPTVRQRDPLGFVERRVETDAAAEFVVYPPVSAVDAAALEGLLSDDPDTERQEFDRLREYVPGDPLRDVHWKSSAKRDDLLVMEFSQPTQTGAVTIAADAAQGYADEMAAATASLALAAMDLGLEVAAIVPADALPAGRGERHRERLLRLLARTGAGALPEGATAEADVTVRADAEGTTVTVSDREQAVETLVRTSGSATQGGAP